MRKPVVVRPAFFIPEADFAISQTVSMNKRINLVARKISVHLLSCIEREQPLRVREPDNLHALHSGKGTHRNIAEAIGAFLTRPKHHAELIVLFEPAKEHNRMPDAGRPCDVREISGAGPLRGDLFAHPGILHQGVLRSPAIIIPLSPEFDLVFPA